MGRLTAKINVWDLFLGVSLSVVLAVGGSASAADSQGTHQYKMRSALEYNGESQFSSQTEAIMTVCKELMPAGKVRYTLSPRGLGSGHESLGRELSFVVDRRTQHLSGADSDLLLLQKVTNQCVVSVAEVTKDNVGKTWKQTFDLQGLGGSSPRELSFTLTAIPLETEIYGELIGVRALSEPFFVQTGEGSVQCRMNCVYVFGSDFEDIFLSASVFSATTNFNGYPEILKHTVATWRVDASGRPASMNELSADKDLAKLMSKLGMSSSLKVSKPAPLPQWAQSDGVRAAQVANICAAIACEGALNPVATIYMPVASTVGLQSFGKQLTAGTLLTAAVGAEGAEGGGDGGGGGGGPFDFVGWNLPTGVFGAGLGFGIAGAAGAFDDDDTKYVYRSPVSP